MNVRELVDATLESVKKKAAEDRESVYPGSKISNSWTSEQDKTVAATNRWLLDFERGTFPKLVAFLATAKVVCKKPYANRGGGQNSIKSETHRGISVHPNVWVEGPGAKWRLRDEDIDVVRDVVQYNMGKSHKIGCALPHGLYGLSEQGSGLVQDDFYIGLLEVVGPRPLALREECRRAVADVKARQQEIIAEFLNGPQREKLRGELRTRLAKALTKSPLKDIEPSELLKLLGWCVHGDHVQEIISFSRKNAGSLNMIEVEDVEAAIREAQVAEVMST